MNKYLPDLNYFLNKAVPGKEDYIITDHIGSGGNAHVFKAYSERLLHSCACKIIPKQNLIGIDFAQPKWEEEFKKPNILRTPPAVHVFHVNTWIDMPNKIDCVVLCSEFIKGWNLEKYAKEIIVLIDLKFITDFLKEMLKFIDNMEIYKITHGDLNSRNIIVEDRRELLGESGYTFRITDFGVTYSTGHTKFRDDYCQLAIVLRDLLLKINYQGLGARDKYTYDILNDYFLARYLTEKDTTREPLARQTRGLYDRLMQIDKDFTKCQEGTAQTTLITPFDYLSCEQIGEAYSLFNNLYSNLFLGLQQVESKNNLVLTGPRGCGKSMVFKSLSLRYRACINNDSPDKVDYVGVYYRCCNDLYFVFPRYKQPEREDAYNIPLHFLTVTLISEMLESIELWAEHYFKNELLEKEERVSKAIWKIISINHTGVLGANSFKSIVSYFQKERKRVSDLHNLVMRKEEVDIDIMFGPDVLLKVCDELIKGLNFLQNKPFYFFIDDYSMPKITKDLQSNLNRLVMLRTPHAFFKLSTESPVSYFREDLDGKAYVEGREFELLNLALVYLETNHEIMLRFIEDIFNRRFKAITGYPVTNLDEMLGSFIMPSSNEIGMKLRDGIPIEMWGKQVLCELCSGDIFYIISLVGRMESDNGGIKGLQDNTNNPRIHKDTQRKAIRSEAGKFLDGLRRIKNGEHLVKIVTAFGNVAFSYLKYKNSKNEKNNPPHLAVRIEPYVELQLNSEAQNKYNELLRYSLFIEDPRGKSQRGRVVPRLYMRRLLIPNFKLAFSKRDSIGLENWEIEELLLNPEEFEKRKQLKIKTLDNGQEELNLTEENDK